MSNYSNESTEWSQIENFTTFFDNFTITTPEWTEPIINFSSTLSSSLSYTNGTDNSNVTLETTMNLDNTTVYETVVSSRVDTIIDMFGLALFVLAFGFYMAMIWFLCKACVTNMDSDYDTNDESFLNKQEIGHSSQKFEAIHIDIGLPLEEEPKK